ncbi:hypothetical protein D9E46_18660 [Escherichia coli]|nr:hypothetical protein [Escherichia coli]
MLREVLAVPVTSHQLAGTALFTQQKRVSPCDGLITQSTRAKRKRSLKPPTNAGALLCCVWRN